MEEEVPPPYPEAVSRDVWILIGPYVDPPDLHAACLVSRAWNRIFTKMLWEEPIFTKEDASRYQTFNTFLYCLKHGRARFQARQCTRTITLGPQSADLPVEILPQWLDDLLGLLPALTSIILPRFPFLDHASVQVLHDSMRQSIQPTQHFTQSSRSYDVRLLDISGCQNVVPYALMRLLSHLPHLVYLDISSLTGLGGLDFWRSFSREIRSVEVLKLRNTSLTDHCLKRVVRAVGTRVWSLDVRDNMLSDLGVLALVDFCFPAPEYSVSGRTPSYELRDSMQDGLPAQSKPRINDDAESIAAWLSNHGSADSLPRSGDGLVNLYISNNPISIEGFTILLKASRLRIFDCGQLFVTRPLEAMSRGRESVEVTQARDMKELRALIRDYAGQSLWRLRIGHRLVTADAVREEQSSHGGSSVLPAPYQLAAELAFLDTLILTDVPSFGAPVAAALISFLTGCAHHNRSPDLGSHDQSSTAPPSGAISNRTQRTSQRRQGLRTLQLEMAKAPGPTRREREPRSVSITEDADSDTFLRAAANDFSFFADESSQITKHAKATQQPPERASIPSEDPSTANPTPSHRRQSAPTSQAEEANVIASLVQFRNDRRAAAAAVAAASGGGGGAQDSNATTTAGPTTLPADLLARARDHWPGKVTIINA